MGAIRDRAREVLSVVPPLGQQINSVGPTASLFTQLTGVTQATLTQNWASGGIMTTCNAFTGWFGNQLGSKLYLGRFDLDTYLPKNGKGDAWVKSTPDTRPKYGDIVRYAKFHVGVSLDFEGDIWTHVDSGQGGSKTGYDIIKRKRDPNTYSYTQLLGWVDIEAYFEGTPAVGAQQSNPVPDWLLGWWNVKWRGQAFYYYFGRNNDCQWTLSAPRDTTRPALVANDSGVVAIDVPNALTVKWATTGSVEKFARLQNGAPMRGTWNDTEPLTATKM